MFKNTASQQWVVFAFQDEGGASPGEPVTGDQSNITADVHIDGGSANAVDDTNPTQLAGGYYSFGITAAESNGDSIAINPVSGTGNVNVIGVPGAVYTRTDVSGVEAKIDTIDQNVDDIETDTADMQPRIVAIETDTQTTLNDKIDTIQAKTDDLTFTKALELDVNQQSVNGVTITGDGSGTKFGV